MTARLRMRRLDAGRPRAAASSVSPAMATARSTDGSQRVRVPNRTSATSPPARRPLRRRRPRNGSEEGEDEGHVLPRYDEQVREARGPEVVGDLGPLLAVVAQDEAGEQGPPLGRQVGRAAQQRPPEAVGQAAGHAARGRQRRAGHREPGPHVAPGQPHPGVGRHGLQLAPQLHPLPRQPVAQGPGRRAAGPRLDPLPADAHVDPEGAGHLGRVADQGGHARPRPRGRAVASRPTPGHRGPTPPSAAPTISHDRPAQQEGDGDQDQHRQEGQRPGRPGAEAGDHGQDDRGPVAHQTRTSGRSASSLAGPMPGTSSSSVTDRNRPWLAR